MKTCDNCKYNTGFRYPDPCMSCEFLADNRNNWEPMESESTTYKNGVWETGGDKKRTELLDKEKLIRHATQDGAYDYISAHEIEEMEPASITELLLAVQEWLMEHPRQYLVLNRDEDGNQWFSIKTYHGAKEIIEFEVK